MMAARWLLLGVLAAAGAGAASPSSPAQLRLTFSPNISRLGAAQRDANEIEQCSLLHFDYHYLDAMTPTPSPLSTRAQS
jgi:hypothetical protein